MVKRRHPQFEPMVLVEHIDSFAEYLSPSEKRFIISLMEKTPKFFSEKQIDWIEDIYDERT